jgi:beta-xylosidase
VDIRREGQEAYMSIMKKVVVMLSIGVLLFTSVIIFHLIDFAEQNLSEGIAMQSDNGDGTYTNPIFWGDYPDPDVIRVGEDYYLSTTSMQYFPGCPIMKSKDLVNWKTIGYAADGEKLMKAYDPSKHPGDDRSGKLSHMILDGGDIYGNGPWASSIRYRDGVFYVLYSCNDLNTSFMSIATDPSGEWEVYDLGHFLYDPSLFFDDDGTPYVFCQRITANISYDRMAEFNEQCNNIRITKLTLDCKGVAEGPKVVFNNGSYIEGIRAYKVDGYYYILNIAEHPMIAHRAKNIYGPYEKKEPSYLLDDTYNFSQGFAKQGSIVQLPNGDWWSIVFQDFGSIGRRPLLLPIKWVDNWPMYGLEGNGKAVVTNAVPNTGVSSAHIYQKKTDYFDSDKLGLQWQWNHVPDALKWSLTERKGYLRLKTASNLNDIFNIYNARNTLTQRVEGPSSCATIEMDISNMKFGDVAGLSVLQAPYGYIGIEKVSDTLSDIIMVNNTEYLEFEGQRVNKGDIIERVINFTGKTIYFRAETTPYTERALFYYSTDNINWKRLGNDLVMKYSVSVFCGNRFSIFNFSTLQEGGFVDVNWFKLYSDRTGGLYSAFRKTQLEQYDEKPLSAGFENAKDIEGAIEQCTVGVKEGDVFKFNNINFFGGASKMILRAKGSGIPARVDVRLDSPTGPVIGKFLIDGEGWQDFSSNVPLVRGKHSLYILCSKDNISMNWFKFIPATATATIETSSGFLTVDSNGKLIISKDKNEKFNIEDAGDGNIYLKSQSSGKYVTVDGSNRSLSATASDKGVRESFALLDLGGSKGLASVADKSFVAVADNTLSATADYTADSAKLIFNYEGEVSALPVELPGLKEDFESYDISPDYTGSPFPLSDWKAESSGKFKVVDKAYEGAPLSGSKSFVLSSDLSTGTGATAIYHDINLDSKAGDKITIECLFQIKKGMTADENASIFRFDINNGERLGCVFDVVPVNGKAVIRAAGDGEMTLKAGKTYKAKAVFISGTSDYELYLDGKKLGETRAYGTYMGTEKSRTIDVDKIKIVKLVTSRDCEVIVDDVKVYAGDKEQTIETGSAASETGVNSNKNWAIPLAIGLALAAGAATFFILKNKKKK